MGLVVSLPRQPFPPLRNNLSRSQLPRFVSPFLVLLGLIIVASHEREMGEFGGAQKLCVRMRLWELPDQYLLEPTDAIASQLLSINRTNGELSSISQLPDTATSHVPHAQIVFGLVGLLKLLAGTYALVITGREALGQYKGCPIYRVTSLKVLSCNNNLHTAPAEEKRDEAHFVKLLKSLESTPGLYFSYDCNLTLTRGQTPTFTWNQHPRRTNCSHLLTHAQVKERWLNEQEQSIGDKEENLHPFQRSCQHHDEAKSPKSVQRSHDVGVSEGSPLWKQADTKYLWNRLLLEELIESKMEPFILPLIQGFQRIQSVVKGKAVSVTLISRRCMKRIGTRMWRRGADMDGNTANFVETEQLLETEGYVASYTQVRGSIPILWEQIVDLSYKPKIKAINYEETPKVVERHFKDLQRRYGDVLAIDLINQQGSEGVLSVAYGDAMQKITNDSLRYIPFDFHNICGNVHFERLSALYEDIREGLDKQGYFLQDPQGKKVELQKGVVRTNCIDCLDRTNVTQSLLGRKALEVQLQRIGIIESNNSIEQFEDLDEKFKILWADHGDDISIQYSGTQALKGDFVRYGKRTIRGLLEDGFNSAARYYYNNFQDGSKQIGGRISSFTIKVNEVHTYSFGVDIYRKYWKDAMDLVAGHYTVSRGSPSPFQWNGVESLAYLPGASALVLAGVYLTSLSVRQLGTDTYQYLYTVLLAGLTAGISAVVKSKGRQFCSRPRLCKFE